MPETPSKPKMICPRCGVEMNHHSDKIVYPADTKDIEQVDPNRNYSGVFAKHSGDPRFF